MNVLILDNYDSFTWNLVQGLEVAGGRCVVHRSDRLSLTEIEAIAPDRLVLSPGPFGPEQAGVCIDAVRHFSGRVPILGVCLGMQVIARAAGAQICPSGNPVHGKASLIRHDSVGVFEGLPNPFRAGRYHSLIVAPHSVPSGMEISAWTEDGHIMGCRLSGLRVEGVLFHPESFLTEHGVHIFENFLSPETSLTTATPIRSHRPALGSEPRMEAC